MSNASCGRAKWPDGGSASGTQLVSENRFGSTAEADRLVGCISAKAALQQNATRQRSSVRTLLIAAFFAAKQLNAHQLHMASATESVAWLMVRYDLGRFACTDVRFGQKRTCRLSE